MRKSYFSGWLNPRDHEYNFLYENKLMSVKLHNYSLITRIHVSFLCQMVEKEATPFF